MIHHHGSLLPTALFDGLSPWSIIFVFAAVWFGFFVRGAFGFGSNMPIVLLTTWVLGPHHAIILVAVAAALAQIHLLPQGPRHADWKLVAALLPGTVVGVVAGTWLLSHLEASGLMAVMGALVLGIVLMDHFKLITWLSKVIDLRALPVSMGLAAMSGVLGTVSGGGGIYFLVGYLRYACPLPAVFRCTNIMISGSFMGARFVSLGIAGLIAFEYMIEALALLPAIFLGTWSGGRFFKASNPDAFYRALQVLMLCAAMALVVRGVVGVG